MFKSIVICSLTLLAGCQVLPQTTADVRAKALRDKYCSQQPFAAAFETIKTAMEKRYDRETGGVAVGATIMPASRRAVRIENQSPETATLSVTFKVANQDGLMLVVDLKRTEECPTMLTVNRLNDSFWKQDSKDFAAAIGASTIYR
jgi:hypothetical protein